MAERVNVVAVAVEILDRQPGLWCQRCLLPSGWRVHVVVRSAGGMHLQEQLHCVECESSRHIVDEAG